MPYDRRVNKVKLPVVIQGEAKKIEAVLIPPPDPTTERGRARKQLFESFMSDDANGFAQAHTVLRAIAKKGKDNGS